MSGGPSPGISAIEVRLAAGCPEPRCRSQRFDLPRDVAPPAQVRCAPDPCGCRSRACGQPGPDRCRHPSTRRLHCLRGAPTDDGFDTAAPRTRRSPCDPRPAAAGGAGDGGRMACSHRGGKAVGQRSEGMPCCDNDGAGTASVLLSTGTGSSAPASPGPSEGRFNLHFFGQRPAFFGQPFG
jgi:hypothetical protein